MKRAAKSIFLLCLLAVMVIINPQVTDSASPKGETFTNSIGMKFVLIPADTFKMGSNDGDKDEKPVHEVTITKPFYMQTTEVTQGQYNKVMGTNPSYFSDCGDECPVERVAWKDAQTFIRKLNDMEGMNKYRLPTEAEWEYACRAGSVKKYSFGSSTSELGNYAWYNSNANGKTHPVAQKKPNKWGLYDMHGNVGEWCQDWYDENYYSRSPERDPEGPSSDTYRVLRGGSWHHRFAWFIRSANRGWHDPDNRFNHLGFRVARASAVHAAALHEEQDSGTAKSSRQLKP
jgi:formylglycine-generating enzyme required for sulfatase activity